jgi:hypothetical protein
MQFRLRTLLILLAILPPIVAVIGPPVVQWLKKKPLPPPTANPTASSAPYFVIYATGPADPRFAESATRTLMAGTQARIQLDSKTGKLTVWGPPSVHKSVQAIIGELQRQPATIITTKSSASTQPDSN